MVDDINNKDTSYSSDTSRTTPGAAHTPVHTAPVSTTPPRPARVEIDAHDKERDLVRWGPVIAGLFSALSALVVLAVLGMAIGLSAVDSSDQLREFGIGAGWWGAISVLLAFMIGGLVAGYTASRVNYKNHGAVNGMMVWAVTIPLILFLISGGIASAFRTAGSVAATAAEAAAPAVGQAAENATSGTDPQDLAAQTSASAAALKERGQDMANQLQQAVTPEKAEQVAEKAAPSAWWTLVSLLLALAAAVGGGILGAGMRSDNDEARYRTANA